MKKIILISLFLTAANQLMAQNTYPFPASGNVGIGTTNPTSWFGGPVLQIEGSRPVLRLAPSTSGGLGTILFKGAFSEGVIGSADEFHFNYVSNPDDPSLVLGAYKNGPKTVITLKGSGNVGIGTETPSERLTVNGNMKLILDPGTFPDKNVASIVALGYSGITGARNWALRGVYQHGFGVGNNADGGDLDLIKSFNGNTVLATKTDGTAMGDVGIGTVSPRATFDVSKYIADGSLSTVFGRLPEGDNIGNGTFLGTQAYNTNVIDGKSFSIVHNFYGETNSSINFHRGGDKIGGSISFSTYSNLERMRIDAAGNVGIGTTTPNEKLAVNGKIRAKEVKVEATNWPDYVFEEGYNVGTLAKLESYIKANKHLPDMPSAKEVETNGIAVSEMLKMQQKKIEELTLHLIEKDKQLLNEKEINKKQQNQLISFEERLKKIENSVSKSKNKH